MRGTPAPQQTPADIREAESLARLSLGLAVAAPLVFFVVTRFRGSVELALTALVVVAPVAALVVAAMAIARYHRSGRRGDQAGRAGAGRLMAVLAAVLSGVEIVLIGLIAAWLWAFRNFEF